MEVIRKGLALPPRWLTSYNDFITSNSSSVTQIESTLRSLTYVLPIHTLSSASASTPHAGPRAAPTTSDVLSESLHTSIQLLSLYHDGVLFRAAGPPSNATDDHARYTSHWTRTSTTYRHLARLLAFVRYTELLAEMAARRRGERVRWRVVVVLELVKAVCKLLLLRVTRQRPLVNPPLPFRTEIPAASSVAHSTDSPDGQPKGHLMRRTQQEMAPLPRPEEVSGYLQRTLLSPSSPATQRPAGALLAPLSSPALLAAEYIYILVPLLHAVLLWRLHESTAATGQQRASRRARWAPWVLCLALELLARRLRGSHNERNGYGAGRYAGTRLEREEWGKRGWAMGWWAMRGAFWQDVTRGVVFGARDRLPGFLRGFVDDYLWLWDGYHFSASME